jgi:hypothetical protein
MVRKLLSTFRGRIAAFLGTDDFAAGGAQGGLLNGKVLIDPC